MKILPFLSRAALLTGAMLLPLWTKPVLAQVNLSPLVLEVEAEQGQARAFINVTNQGDTAFRARVSAEPFTYQRTGFQLLEESDTDLTPYLIFSPRELVVEPGQTRRIRLLSRFLPSQAAGEYRAVIFTENLETGNSAAGTSVGIIPRIGATLYVRHGEVGEATPTVTMAEFNADRKAFNLLVTNTGGQSVRPVVDWTLSQDGRTINEGITLAMTVIAGGDRNIPIEYLNEGDMISPGLYTLTGELLYGNQSSPRREPFSFDVTVTSETATTANQPPIDSTLQQ